MDYAGDCFRLNFLINGTDSYEIYKTYSEVQLFCQELLDLCDLSLVLSDICTKIVISTDSADVFQELNELFRLVLDTPAIVQSEVFSIFLWDFKDRIDEEKASNRSATSAVEFLLQSSESKQLYIPRKAVHKLEFHLVESSTLVWRFCIQGGYDVDFSASFELYNDTQTLSTDINHAEILSKQVGTAIQIVKALRVCTPMSSTILSFSASDCIQGSYSAISPGKLSLIFDNTYSFVNGKYLEIATEIASRETLEAALVAAEDSYTKYARIKSKVYIKILESKTVSLTIDYPANVAIRRLHDRITTSAEAVTRTVMASKLHVGNAANNARVSSDLGTTAAGVTSDPITGDVVLSSTFDEQLLHNRSPSANATTSLPPSEELLSDDSVGNPPWLVTMLSLAAKLPIAGRWIPQTEGESASEVPQKSNRSPNIRKSQSGWNYFGDCDSPDNQESPIISNQAITTTDSSVAIAAEENNLNVCDPNSRSQVDTNELKSLVRSLEGMQETVTSVTAERYFIYLSLFCCCVHILSQEPCPGGGE